MNRWPLACGLWLLGLACIGARRATGHTPQAVTISNFAFSPRELSVSVGDTVVWTNDDALLHTTSADSGAWSSPELQRGERYRFVTTRAGRFPYHCSAHAVMRATLVVRP